MIAEAIRTVVSGESLTQGQAGQVMEEVLTAQVTPAQFGAFVTALALKGESADEIAGFGEVMRRHATRVNLDGVNPIDTCGTGGSKAGWFNVSTTAALVAAGAGAKVAKHGNRSMSGASGSADVLEALGVNLAVSPDVAARCVREAGVGFMFAQAFHPAMKFAAPLRREIGIRTVFNILGPLTNPAGARRQLLGVADWGTAPLIAEALGKMKSEHALVVHGHSGVDEISLTGPTQIAELSGGRVRTYEIGPGDLGLNPANAEEFAGGTPRQNAEITRAILQGAERGPRRDLVLANSAGALLVAGIASDWKDGVRRAARSIDDGAALDSLDRLVEITNNTATN